MQKPLIIISDIGASLQATPAYITNSFIRNGFSPIICPFDVAAISDNKDKTEYFLINLPNVFSNEIRQVCFFLRDLCIDEEKSILCCGSSKNIDLARKILPSMVLKGTFEAASGDIDYVTKQTKMALRANDDRPGCLIIDTDMEYNRNLRLALHDFCDVAFSDGTLKETTPFIQEADLVILSMELEMSILDFMLLESLLSRQKKERQMNIVSFAADYARQNAINSATKYSGVCLSKETDFIKNANYIKRRYFSKSL